MDVPLCAIIPVRNEADRVAHALGQLHRAGIRRAVIVVNGSRDGSAAAARQAVLRLRWAARVLEFRPSLGPDVPRAVGTFAALRAFPDTGWFLYADGDWGGGFGPMLQDWVSRAQRSGAQVTFVGNRTLRKDGSSDPERPDLQLWRTTLGRIQPAWRDVSPSESPWLVHRAAFHDVSAYWLHHPGQWFARCALARERSIRLAVVRGWDPRLAGNRNRTESHARRMLETLVGDAVEGCCVLLGRRPTRRWKGVWWNGYHADRRLDILRRVAGSWRPESP
ncbi:hypothetical protein [Alicyclobacillus sp.]|uniref:hypothetical protein n=1 Tax=Alicyclobacillus sp. TaxID=61169 RepID=UPI0025BFF2FE|nr:hypothetical protein [Alicyclobacillus sp.]MCL6516625.1 hypothetical protein [Alicyclobacillus sp.]